MSSHTLGLQLAWQAVKIRKTYSECDIVFCASRFTRKPCFCYCFCFQIWRKKQKTHELLHFWFLPVILFLLGETAGHNFIIYTQKWCLSFYPSFSFSLGDLTFSVSWHFYHCYTHFFVFLPHIHSLREITYFISWKAGMPSVLDKPFNCSDKSSSSVIDQSLGTGPWGSLQSHETHILSVFQRKKLNTMYTKWMLFFPLLPPQSFLPFKSIA